MFLFLTANFLLLLLLLLLLLSSFLLLLLFLLLVPPSYGDVTVSNSYVIMSISVDFKYNLSKVTNFCGVSDLDNIRLVLSRQLGYHKDGCHFLNK